MQYYFPWQLPQLQQAQAAQAAQNAGAPANPVNTNIDQIWAGSYPRSMFSPPSQQQPQPQSQSQSQITPQAQAYMNLTPQGGNAAPDGYSLAGLLGNLGGDAGSQDVSVTGGPTAAYTPAQDGSQGSGNSGSGFAAQRMQSAYTPNDAPANANTVRASNAAPDLGAIDGTPPALGTADLPLGGTYDPNSNTSSWLDGLISYTPKAGQSDLDRQRLISASLKDMGQWMRGRGDAADNVQGEEQNQLKLAQQQRSLAALGYVQQQLGAANGDPAKTRAALVQAALLGFNSGDIQGALSYGTPQYKGYDRDQNVYAMDPTTGRPLAVLQKGVAKPTVSGGMIVQPDEGTATPVPGYLSQQIKVYQAKAAARNANKAPSPNAPINIAHPSTGY
ncbi:MAG TPA: hypothetical protein VGH23_20495 [Rhizomicrobium sp.]|jgi:hypothetical protein